MTTSSFLKRARDIWPVPDARWQSLQWHWPMPSGCPLIEYATAPQRHRPVICTFAISGTPHCHDTVESKRGSWTVKAGSRVQRRERSIAAPKRGEGKHAAQAGSGDCDKLRGDDPKLRIPLFGNNWDTSAITHSVRSFWRRCRRSCNLTQGSCSPVRGAVPVGCDGVLDYAPASERLWRSRMPEARSSVSKATASPRGQTMAIAPAN